MRTLENKDKFKEHGIIPDSEIVTSGNWLRIVKNKTGWEYIERHTAKGVVIIIPVTREGKLILIEQYRFAVDNYVIELPAGLVGDKVPDEDFETAAKRELYEETGFCSKNFEFVMNLPIAPGMTNEMGVLYIAKDSYKSGKGGGDEFEDITVHEIDIDNCQEWLKAMISEGKFIDPKVYTGLWFIRKFSTI